MDEKMLDLAELLIGVRQLSTWGPDFKDNSVLRVWVKKLSKFENELISKALDTLGGKKEFPSPSDIIELASSYNKSRNTKVNMDENPKKTIVRAILQTEAMQDLKKSRYEFFLHLQDELLVRPYSIEDLKKFLETPEEMMQRVISATQGWNIADNSPRNREKISVKHLINKIGSID